MAIKIISVLSIFLGICKAELFTNYAQEQSQNKSQATSSVSFQRKDIPLSYNYHSFHPHTHTRNGSVPISHIHSTPQTLNLPSIQYAPLIKPAEHPYQKSTSNLVNHSPENPLNPTLFLQETSPSSIKKPREPRLEAPPSSGPIDILEEYTPSQLDYVPGHNIEVLRSVNRIPGLNAIYRSITDRTPHFKNKINNLNQFIVSPKYQEYDFTNSIKSTPSITMSAPTPKTTTAVPKSTSTSAASTIRANPQIQYSIPFIQPQQYYQQEPITYAVEKPMIPEKSLYPKMHALLLNVARSYNSRMVPHKALHVGVDPNLSGNAQYAHGLNSRQYHKRQQLMNVPGSAQLHVPVSDQKTILYPVHKKLHFAHA